MTKVFTLDEFKEEMFNKIDNYTDEMKVEFERKSKSERHYENV